jgi:hypothetical protein
LRLRLLRQAREPAPRPGEEAVLRLLPLHRHGRPPLRGPAGLPEQARTNGPAGGGGVGRCLRAVAGSGPDRGGVPGPASR